MKRLLLTALDTLLLVGTALLAGYCCILWVSLTAVNRSVVGLDRGLPVRGTADVSSGVSASLLSRPRITNSSQHSTTHLSQFDYGTKKPLVSEYATKVRLSDVLNGLKCSSDDRRKLEEDLSTPPSPISGLEAAEQLMEKDELRGQVAFGNAVRSIVEITESRLGPDAGERMKEALIQSDLRDATKKIAFENAYSSTPLSADQSQELLHILIDAGNTKEDGGFRKISLSDLDWDDIERHATEILTHSQMLSLAALRAKAEFDKDYQNIVRAHPPTRLPGT